jgi:hypothetical protein
MDRVGASVGLCASCEFRRTVAGARSTFYLCELSFTDPQFPRYPPLPVVRCGGYKHEANRAAAPKKTQ